MYIEREREEEGERERESNTIAFLAFTKFKYGAMVDNNLFFFDKVKHCVIIGTY